MFLPEIKIHGIITNLLEKIRKENSDKMPLERTLLYMLFKKDHLGFENKIGNVDAYEQISSAILKTKESQRNLTVSLGFDNKRVSTPTPTIHILSPSENEDVGKNWIGGNLEDEYNTEIYDNFIEGKDSIQNVNAMFSANFNLLITSDNNNEVVLIYHLLKSLLFLGKDEMELLGFRNLTIRGQDIQIQSNLIPISIFHKNLSISFFYESIIPKEISKSIKSCFKAEGKILV